MKDSMTLPYSKTSFFAYKNREFIREKVIQDKKTIG